LKKTRSSHKKKDWLKANDGFLRILEIDPECAFALKYLQGIETELKRIVDKEPGTRRAYYAEGFFFYNQKKWTDAINSWKIAMALTTGSKKFSLSETEIHDYISRASTNIEKERIAAMPQRPARKPSAKPAAKPGKQEPKPVKVEVDVDKSNEYYNQGLMLFSEGKIRDAVLSWELALRYNPDNHKATRNIIRAKKILEK